MIRFDHCFCPKCGKEHDSNGRLGTSRQCSCGFWMPHVEQSQVLLVASGCHFFRYRRVFLGIGVVFSRFTARSLDTFLQSYVAGTGRYLLHSQLPHNIIILETYE